jgi:arylamine N-acetyltransferase
VLRVHADGVVWHADVGFGSGTLLEPIPFGAGDVHEQSGWQVRVVEDEDELVLQTLDADEWTDLYGFVPEPVPLIDVETSNWFTSTYPRSPFVTGLIITAHRPDGTRVSMTDRGELSLIEQTPTDTAARTIEREQIPALLESQFGLPGFALGSNGRVVSAS